MFMVSYPYEGRASEAIVTLEVPPEVDILSLADCDQRIVHVDKNNEVERWDKPPLSTLWQG